MKLDFDVARLLVVEDHAFQRKLLVEMLQSMGIRRIEQASNGREALTALSDAGRDFLPDVIVCDLEMPEMDGIEFLQAVAERKLARGVIIVSGREAEILRGVEAMASASKLTVLANLSKPVQAARLREALWRDLPDRTGELPAIKAIDPAQLRQAIRDDEFEAVFQPQIQLASSALHAAEALARWTPRGGEPVPPVAFVPALTREGLVAELTGHMLRKSCEAVSLWEQHGLKLGVSVNISMSELADLEVADRYARIVAGARMDPRRVTLEVTETEVMADAARVLNGLSRLRLKGFQLAIDDFGTGYSSLQQLNTLPFTELKVDQAFVKDCADSLRLRSIVAASIRLARRLGMKTVAEGIESKSDWDFVSAKRCDYGQGFFIARPMPAAALPGWAIQWLGRSQAHAL